MKMSCLLFSSIEDFLSKFNTLRIILEGYKVKKEDGSLIYSILAKLGTAYSVFVSTFHSTREALISQGTPYKSPYFDAFCDFLIREQDKFLQLGLINTGNSSKKTLAAQQQPYPKNSKQHPKKNGRKPNKGLKQSQPQIKNQLIKLIRKIKTKGRRQIYIATFVIVMAT